MPWRLVQFIIVFAIFLVFIILNLGNNCDISFGFTKFSDVPVFLTAFFSFIAGMLCTLPFIFGFRSRKKDKVIPGEEKQSKKTGQSNGDNYAENSHFGIN